MEIPAQDLKLEDRKTSEGMQARPHVEINLLGIASNADGAVAARFSDIVQRDFDAAVPPNQTLHYEKEFKIAPGQYHLNIAFSSGGSRVRQGGNAALSRPARDAGRLALSAIVLGRQIRPAAELGLSELGLNASLLDSGTPLIAGGQQLIPTGSNVFTRAQPAYCYFEVYTPGHVGLPNPASAHRESDHQARSTGTAAMPSRASPSTKKSRFQPRLRPRFPIGLSPPHRLASPGSYRLELSAVAAGEPRRAAIA